MKLRLFQTILSILLLCTPIVGKADDFVKLANKTAWKVQECALEGQDYKVKVCFSDKFCEKKYPEKEYACEKGIACGENFVKSSNLSKGKLKWAASSKTFDGSFFLTVPPEKLKKEDSKNPPQLASIKTTTNIPVVIYPSKPYAEVSEIRAAMKKYGIPSNSLLFTLTKSNGQYALTSAAQSSDFKMVLGESVAQDQAATIEIADVLKEFLAQELSNCPD